MIGTVSQYAFKSAPSSATAGSLLSIEVQAQDAFGNLKSSEQRDVTVDVSGSVSGASVDSPSPSNFLLNIIHGRAYFNLRTWSAETLSLSLDDTAGTGLDVTSTADIVVSAGLTLTFRQHQIDFHSGSATKVDLSVASSSATVGDTVVCSFSCEDAFGNTDDSISGQITLDIAIGSSSSSETITITAGVASFNFQANLPGVYRLSLTDSFSLGLDVSDVAQVQLSPGKLVFLQN
jgi:hypothetical protein